MSSPRLQTIAGQPSWSFRSDLVQAYLTQTGGHLAPVRFQIGRKAVQPFSISPWATERIDSKTPAILKVLRGDFFCCPFGGNATPWRGEKHPVHGESANSKWTLRSIQRSGNHVQLHASLNTTIRRGRIDKFITLVDGQTVLYQRHVLSGMLGAMPVGHHPTLLFPDSTGSGLLSFSPFVRAQVYPGDFERPENRGYQSLKPGEIFDSIDRVPLLTGGYTDLSRYPARRGYEDLVMLTADRTLPFAWSAVAFPAEGYVWFSLRDPQVLRQTILWISNGGRHYAPWSGRHINVMGIEDTTSYFHEGLAESTKANSINRSATPTKLMLSPKKPTSVCHIMGIVAIPRGFDHVAEIEAVGGGIRLSCRSGIQVRCGVDLQQLHEE